MFPSLPSFALGRFASRVSGAPPFTGLAVGGRVRELAGADVAAVLERWPADRDRLRALAADASGPWHDEEDLTPLVPVEPRQIFQAGANYRKHVVDIVVAELDDDSQGATEPDKRAYAEELMDRRAREGEPYVFLGAPSALCGARDDIVLPVRDGAAHDWELELAVVVGRGGYRISREDAAHHIGGYTIANDITSRDLVYRRDLPKLGTDWLAAKNSPTFLPVGPVVVPAEFVPDPSALDITLYHNGTARQQESTKDMIFDVARLVDYVSHRVALLPGDLILTGSPAGNGVHWGLSLHPGDLLEGHVTGLGYQRNRCVTR